jgi:hypothetical protein
VTWKKIFLALMFSVEMAANASQGDAYGGEYGLTTQPIKPFVEKTCRGTLVSRNSSAWTKKAFNFDSGSKLNKVGSQADFIFASFPLSSSIEATGSYIFLRSVDISTKGLQSNPVFIQSESQALYTGDWCGGLTSWSPLSKEDENTYSADRTN